MEICRENSKLIITLDKKIDTSNAMEVETQIFLEIDKADTKSVIFDAKNLEYISSAGLRVLLKVTKKGIHVSLTEVSLEVYEILEVTGFVSLLEVHKALRTISIDGCKMIGQGGTAKVYRLDKDTIVKLYNDNVTYEKIEKEKLFTRKAFELGMPCAISFDIVKCDDKYGIVYEMLQANTLAETMSAETGKIEEFAAEYAKLGRLIHGLEADPEVYPRTAQLYHDEIELLAPWIEQEEREILHNFVKQVPEPMKLIHGDFHLNNIMLQGGEYLLIDMADVSWGHPVFELACTYVSLVSVCSQGSEFTRNMYGLEPEELMRVWKQFVKTYFDVEDEKSLSEIDTMLKPFVALKTVLRAVSSGTVSEAMVPMLIGMVKTRLLPEIAAADNKKISYFFK